MNQLAVLTSGLWKLRRRLEAATGAEVVRWSLFHRPSFDAVGGWGCKPTSCKARALASQNGRAYISFEDGWIRSIRPGAGELPLSIVVDCVGTHYDATKPSDLENLVGIAARRSAGTARARRGIELLRSKALSKYNLTPMMDPSRLGLGPRPRGGRVLVADQTVGDASIAGGLASADTFARMLHAARIEHPDAEILVKTHPEVTDGRKKGFLSNVSGPGIRLLYDAVNPWSLFDIVDHVYVVSSQLGFEALMADLPVTCFGAPYYAGWGLTDDRVALPRRKARPSLEQLFAALYFDYAHYFDPVGDSIGFEEAIFNLTTERRRMQVRAHAGLHTHAAAQSSALASTYAAP